MSAFTQCLGLNDTKLGPSTILKMFEVYFFYGRDLNQTLIVKNNSLKYYLQKKLKRWNVRVFSGVKFMSETHIQEHVHGITF